MDNIKIKDAKKVLKKLLEEIDVASDKATAENNFTLVLRLLYVNPHLQEKSEIWIKSIENKENFSDDILGNENFNIFYCAYPTRSKYYKYYVNKLGIVLLVKTESTDDFSYNEQHGDNNWWLIPINEDGCLDADSFNEKYNLPVLIAHSSIFGLMKKVFLEPDLQQKENYEAHHIVCNNDPSNKNDARDNRCDNIIYIPKNLHVHAKLYGQDEEKAKDLYKKTLELLNLII